MYIGKRSWSITRPAVAVGIAALLAGPPASAHQDPPGCFETGAAIIVSVFRANGTTGLVGSVSECETINFRATLTKAGAETVCAFSEGTFSLTTPDGVEHTINADVPCIGGTADEGCDPTVTQLQSNLIPYTVDPSDVVGGLITATAQYADGVAHDSEDNTAGVDANTPRSIPVIFCDDNNLCTTDVCDPEEQAANACSSTPVVCDDDDACTTEECNPATGLCDETPVDCNDDDLCTTDTCDPATGCVNTAVVCTDNDACTTDTCDPATGQCATTDEVECDDNDVCTDDVCDPATGQCVFTRDDTNDPSCNPVGCRITAGGIAPNGGVDLGDFASISTATHGGQVGAPCGCIGCFDEFDHVQGQWQHQRHRQKGSFHASDYNSLVCGCDGVLDGNLCGDRDTGPLPRPAPANTACFSGTGTLKRGAQTVEVAFRVEVEDRGEPGAGGNSAPTPDVYRIRIWVPKGLETPEDLASGACCTNTQPTGDAARAPDIDDGGNVSRGNVQIHPQIPAHIGECPVPDGQCVE